MAMSLGADVPVCLTGKACRMRGAGERIDILEDFAPLAAVLVNPGEAVSTGDVFARLALKPGDTAFSGLDEGRTDFASCRNDLVAPTRALAPVIDEVIAALDAEPGLRYARMSGSGATCFGIFRSLEAAKTAGRRIAGAHPQWWVMPTMIG